MRLIDANALLNTETFAVSDSACKECENEYRWEVMNAPTVDAVEVVHGRWLDATHIDEDFGEVESYECSVCGKWDYYTPNYCPNCGAKMDGDGNG